MGAFQINIASLGAQQVHFYFALFLWDGHCFGLPENSGNLLEGNLTMGLTSNIINPIDAFIASEEDITFSQLLQLQEIRLDLATRQVIYALGSGRGG